MNKRTKGLVAGGAGAVILLGTAGTFALWSDTATAPGAVVTGGELELAGDSAVTWTANDISSGSPVVISPDDGEIQLVAGVELVGETTITPELAGDYLKAQLVTQTGAPVPDWLDVEWKVGDTVLGTSPEDDATFSVELTPADLGAGATPDTLSVSIRLADHLQDSSDGVDLTDESWSPGDFTVTLQQLPPSQS
ncbi:MAG: alternate-type signal peptide domain-containing protein [Cellulomonas sp.]|jgi:alternate signal-mediated exported protein|uniref:alternate-type signal peptide domain-containing protein n=1 Tax=Cellulomonas sp. TaxID=40001 RepID=UPI0019EECCEC|nr:alternate-type signal peptide domain-containing protein [Cellulomonas sp.]MBF0688271.1 alternate-type signal peptide domain-containing protein [Cellulomonas sp.]